MTLGEAVRNRRKIMYLTQDDVCKRVKLSKGYYSDFENGKRSMGINRFYRLCRVLKISMDKMYSRGSFRENVSP